MRPVDTDTIQAEITQLETRKRVLDNQLDKLNSPDDRLPELEQQRTQIKDQIQDKRAELKNKNTEMKDADRIIDDTREQNFDFEDAHDELQSTRSGLDNV
ncbi:hypothetical protein [Halococcus sp. IIIV-5B]|uniref:hypothetical protein n=1 Tax=Halococcus sp. IIIV-5B TaxID=2321230 RepID=UPI001F301446|nr:hypothetical protein [Halococcus sp. IIIV-5B]